MTFEWPGWRFVRLALLAALALAAIVAALAAVGDFAARLRSVRLIDAGRTASERYAARLAAELHRFDFLPRSLEYHPSIAAVLETPHDPGRVAAANSYLEALNRISGGTALYLTGLNGVVVAASNWREDKSFVGVDLSYRPYIRKALQAGSDRFYGIGTTSEIPGYYFAQALPEDGEKQGVGVVKVSLERLQNRPAGERDVIITDENGVVILSSRPQWRYRTLQPLAADALERLKRARQYEKAPLTPLDIRREQALDAGAAIVSLPADAAGTRRARFLAQEQRLDNSPWSVTVLSDISDEAAVRRWAQAAAALAGVALVLLVLLARQRRRAIRLERAASDMLAEANARLEHKVLERTRDLVAANRQLKDTQGELVHAAKLAAIGRFAAGVAHELSQPLSALRTLADNALLLLARAQHSAASDNLGMIRELVDRIARIASELKLFARRDSVELGPVSVRRSIADSLRILDDRIRAAGCSVDVCADEDVIVMADSGGLDQALLNLVANAVDAVSGRADRRVFITARRADGFVRVAVADNGPGLGPEALARAFEPFYTTKAMGAGLGLGLAISEGLARRFGGSLRASNRPQGGAEFEIVLPAPVAGLARAS